MRVLASLRGNAQLVEFSSINSENPDDISDVVYFKRLNFKRRMLVFSYCEL